MKRFNKLILGDKSIVLAPQVHKKSVIWVIKIIFLDSWSR